MVKLHPLVTLFSKSGIGKSSLLNAGIIPQVIKDGQYEPLRIRFEAFVEGKNLSPLDIFRKVIVPNGSASTFLDKLIENEPSLWHDIKEFQIEKNKGLLLIFDQCEELFTYPPETIQEFKRQLVEALYTVVPDRYLNILEKFLSENNGSLPLTDEQMQQLQTPPSIKIIISIRSDRKYFLSKLSDSLLDVEKIGYELNPLEIDQATLAIKHPAQIDDPTLATPVFRYSEEAMQELLRFLTKGGSQKVEPFQLQILCNVLEKKVQKPGQVLQRGDLGDVEKIIENYYEDQLALIKDPKEREAARTLIEKGLILEEGKIRLTLFEGQIARDYPIKPDTIVQLVNSHLLRREVSLKGGFMYELSHDAWVDPVLRAKARHEEAKQKAEEARRRKEEKEELERQQKAREEEIRLEREAREAELTRQKEIADRERGLRLEAERSRRRALIYARIAVATSILMLLLGVLATDYYIWSLVSTGTRLEDSEKYDDAVKSFETARDFDLLDRYTLQIRIDSVKVKQKQQADYNILVSQADSLNNLGGQYLLDALDLYKKAISTGYPKYEHAKAQSDAIQNQRFTISRTLLSDGVARFDAGNFSGALQLYEIADKFDQNNDYIRRKIEQTRMKMK
ncbi:MAG: hypothetical protein IPM81_00625 [Saprospirales bacterium]|nr:hypothetical protein [Saprospirales bacterium]